MYRLTVIAVAAWLSWPAAASAAEPATAVFSFGGFGTLGVVHSSDDRADFTATSFEPNGAGFTHAWSPSVDSRVGGQLTANFTNGLSAVVQLVAEQNYDSTYKPHVEWANLKYQFTVDFSIRAGRTVLADYLVSDDRKVGYAHPWVRPPVEVYDLAPVTNSDGVDTSYRLHTGDVVQTLTASYGQTSPSLPNIGTADGKRLLLLTDTAEYGPATLHFAYLQGHATLRYVQPLFDSFRQFGPQGIALADKYNFDDKPVRFFEVGGIYDPGQWFAMAEWAMIDFHSVVGESSAWYASGGYRVGKWTPYLTYAQVKADSNTSDPGLAVSSLPPALAGAAAALNGGLNALLGSIAVQSTISAGARWDVLKSVDVKLQYDHTRLGAGSAGALTNLQADFRRGGTVNLFSAAIDFVF